MTQHTTAQLSALSTFRDEVLSWIKATGNQNEKDVDSYIENAARHLGDFSDKDNQNKKGLQTLPILYHVYL